MLTDLVVHATHTADRLATAGRSGAFLEGVDEFVATLARIPDYPPGEWAEGMTEALNEASGRVIQLIEGRLSSTRDSSRVRMRLAEAVYDIRARLEAAIQFRRHFLGG